MYLYFKATNLLLGQWFSVRKREEEKKEEGTSGLTVIV
jgi:hypothetical protein